MAGAMGLGLALPPVGRAYRDSGLDAVHETSRARRAATHTARGAGIPEERPVASDLMDGESPGGQAAMREADDFCRPGPSRPGRLHLLSSADSEPATTVEHAFARRGPWRRLAALAHLFARLLSEPA